MYDKFKHWLKTAQRGSRFVYHTGFLGADRSKWNYERAFPILKPVPVVNAVAALAWSAWTAGQIHMAQKRVGNGKFEYIAEKR